MAEKKKLFMDIVAPKVKPTQNKGIMDSWITLSLEQTYVDRRPLWGDPRPVHKGWTPSSLGEPNDRILVSKLLGYRGDAISEKLQRIFHAGNDIESRWVNRFRAMNCFVSSGNWLPNTAGSPLRFSGKIDIIVRHAFTPEKMYLVEVKSISPEGFRTLPSTSRDPDANFDNLLALSGMTGNRVKQYMAQLQTYLHELQMPDGILLFDNKGNQDFLDYYVTHRPDYVASLFARLQRLEKYWGSQLIPPWNGGDGQKSIFATYKPDEDIPLAEFKKVVLEAEDGV